MEQNYFEIVAVPVLQRKFQELFNSNMILETNLHIEITKGRHALEELEKIKTGPSSIESSNQELRSMQSTAANALSDASIYKNKYEASEQQLRSMQATASSALSDAAILTNKYDQASKELACALEEIRALQARLFTQNLDADSQAQKEAAETKEVKVKRSSKKIIVDTNEY